MRHKILIADDSLTIQKVIKITLANEPFEMDVCVTAQELTLKVQSFRPNIVLLDFNLSEDQTGYDLCKKIKAFDPSTKVFMLYGTFDTIDEDLLDNAGCDSKIVKPFDGTKFINTCRSLADQVGSAPSPQLQEQDEYDFEMDTEISSETPAAEDDGGWVMAAPVHKDSSKQTAPTAKAPASTKKSVLELQVEDWGMQVPGVIGDADADHMSIPEVIDFSKAKASAPAKSTPKSIAPKAPESLVDNSALPSDDDLAFPDIISSSQNFDSNDIEFSNGPKLTPLSDLNIHSVEEESDAEESDSGFNEIDFDAETAGTNSVEELKRIEEQIQDEVGHDNLWSFDEVEEIPAAEIKTAVETKKPGKTKLEAVSSKNDLPLVEPHKLKQVFDTLDNMDFDIHHARTDFEADEFKNALKDFPSDMEFDRPAPKKEDFKVDADFEAKVRKQLEPLVEQYVKQYGQAMIEKIAWEVIPDLAENLIRKELQKISDSILNP